MRVGKNNLFFVRFESGRNCSGVTRCFISQLSVQIYPKNIVLNLIVNTRFRTKLRLSSDDTSSLTMHIKERYGIVVFAKSYLFCIFLKFRQKRITFHNYCEQKIAPNFLQRVPGFVN